MHDVEAAGAQLQVPGLHVDHHVVARLGRTHHPHVAQRRAALALHLDHQALHTPVRGLGLHHRSPPELQHSDAASSSASATSSIPSSAATVTPSSGWWLRSVPLARFTQWKPAASSALASDPPPVTMRRGS